MNFSKRVTQYQPRQFSRLGRQKRCFNFARSFSRFLRTPKQFSRLTRISPISVQRQRVRNFTKHSSCNKSTKFVDRSAVQDVSKDQLYKIREENMNECITQNLKDKNNKFDGIDVEQDKLMWTDTSKNIRKHNTLENIRVKIIKALIAALYLYTSFWFVIVAIACFCSYIESKR